MRTTRPIYEKELDDFMSIFANAYPGIDVSSPEAWQRLRSRLVRIARDPAVSNFALFEEGKMRGIMRLYDFTMNLLSTRVLVGGVGSLAVDLLHKKEQVAADMLRFYLRYYKGKGACLAALYPFRPDFYRRMGFGYGTKRSLYRVRPDTLPKGPRGGQVSFLTAADRTAMQTCFTRFMMRHNGLMEHLNHEWESLFATPSLKVVGVWRSGQLSGYLIFKFEKGRGDHFLSNDILVRELIYDSADDLLDLLRFLQVQADQIEHITFYTQDESFHYLFHDPRNDSGNLLPQVYHESNTQGVGIMYRVINVPRLFEVLEGHNFGHITYRLKIRLTDSFFPENAGSTIIHFQDGRASRPDDGLFDGEIDLDVAEFSSLVIGAVNFKRLVDYGLAAISDQSAVDLIDRLFAAPKPICLTEF